MSCVIREAIALHGDSVDLLVMKRRRRNSVNVVHVPIRFGPRMSENIRARLVPAKANASAFVDACCVRYLREHQLL